MRKFLVSTALVSTLAMSGAAMAEEAKKAEAFSWKVTPYGAINGFVEGGTADGKEVSISTDKSKVGVNVKTNGAVYAFGKVEAGVAMDAGDDPEVSINYGYVGVGSSIGELSVGKQKSLAHEWANPTDIFTIGGNESALLPTKKVTNSGKVVVNVPGVDAKVGVMVSADDTTTEDKHVDTYQLAATVKGLGVAYTKNSVNDLTHYNVGYGTKFGPVGVAASYSVKDTTGSAGASDLVKWGTDVTGVTRAVEATVSFDVSDKLTVLGGVGKTDASGDDGKGLGGFTYAINKQTTWFTTGEYDVASSDVVARSGVSFKF